MSRIDISTPSQYRSVEAARSSATSPASAAAAAAAQSVFAEKPRARSRLRPRGRAETLHSAMQLAKAETAALETMRRGQVMSSLSRILLDLESMNGERETDDIDTLFVHMLRENIRRLLLAERQDGKQGAADRLHLAHT